MPRPRPVLLCILDGWGYRADAPDNATTRGHAPVFWNAWETCPHAVLNASEEYVGLPAGQMGNSEVGHMNLGSGRTVYQDLPMIDRAIALGELDVNPKLQELITTLKKSGGTCHLMGLVSPGGIHTHQNHIAALARIVAKGGGPVALHAFLDGRDTPPQSAETHVTKLLEDVAPYGNVTLATLCGRYYAMDRDKRWERVALATAMLTEGTGTAAQDPIAAIKESYAKGENDEFVKPIILNGFAGMKDGDGILFAHFRADRAREILTALLDPTFDGFTPKKRVSFAAAAGLVAYSTALNKEMTALFPPKKIEDSLGEVMAVAGLTQLRIAETEKYPHVTFFFNGGREEPFAGEERILIPSPKVATYDLQPEMSAPLVTDKILEAITADQFDLIVVNYANPDMVGHTGDFNAAVKAVEALDVCLGRLFAAMKERGGVTLVTADHGNCEMMHDATTNGPHTAHTLDQVPVILIGASDVAHLRNGKLADVAPTLLEIMGLPKPNAMDGQSLIVG